MVDVNVNMYGKAQWQTEEQARRKKKASDWERERVQLWLGLIYYYS